MAASRATRVLVAFEESVRHYKHPEKVEVVGMPVRKEFLFTTKEQARKALGVTEPLVVSAFGSQGAKVMNETIADMMVLEQADGFPFRHIHATGSFGKEWMPKRVKDNGVDYENCPAIDIREYIYDMPTVLTGGGCGHRPAAPPPVMKPPPPEPLCSGALSQRDQQSPGEERPGAGNPAAGRWCCWKRTVPPKHSTA